MWLFSKAVTQHSRTRRQAGLFCMLQLHTLWVLHYSSMFLTTTHQLQLLCAHCAICSSNQTGILEKNNITNLIGINDFAGERVISKSTRRTRTAVIKNIHAVLKLFTFFLFCISTDLLKARMFIKLNVKAKQTSNKNR